MTEWTKTRQQNTHKNILRQNLFSLEICFMMFYHGIEGLDQIKRKGCSKQKYFVKDVFVVRIRI